MEPSPILYLTSIFLSGSYQYWNYDFWKSYVANNDKNDIMHYTDNDISYTTLTLVKVILSSHLQANTNVVSSSVIFDKSTSPCMLISSEYDNFHTRHLKSTAGTSRILMKISDTQSCTSNEPRYNLGRQKISILFFAKKWKIKKNERTLLGRINARTAHYRRAANLARVK